jgi:hypothetical protein
MVRSNAAAWNPRSVLNLVSATWSVRPDPFGGAGSGWLEEARFAGGVEAEGDVGELGGGRTGRTRSRRFPHQDGRGPGIRPGCSVGSWCGAGCRAWVRSLPEANTMRNPPGATLVEGSRHLVGWSGSSVRCHPAVLTVCAVVLRSSIQSLPVAVLVGQAAVVGGEEFVQGEGRGGAGGPGSDGLSPRGRAGRTRPWSRGGER